MLDFANEKHRVRHSVLLTFVFSSFKSYKIFNHHLTLSPFDKKEQ